MKRWMAGFVVLGAGAVFLLQPLELRACKQYIDENAKLKSELEAAGQRNTELEARVNEDEKKIEVQNQELSDLRNLVAMKNNDLQRLYDTSQILESTLKGLGDILQASGGELSGKMMELMKSKQGLENEVAALRNDIDAAFNRNERLNQLIGEYQNKLNNQTVELKNAKSERDSLQKTAEDLRRSLKADTEDLSKQVAALTAQKQNLDKQLAELRKNIDTQLAAEAADKERMKSTYEQLLASLDKEVGQKTIEIQQYKDALTINIMDKVFFDSGKADIKPEGIDVLRRVGTILKGVPEKNIRIEGHTDDIPIGQKIAEKYPTNWELGAARAANVAEFLRKEVGIDAKRMSVVSYSMYRPIVPHTTKENRAKNRRIEIVVIDKLNYQMMETKESAEQ
jgi:chemotaxis protein MotB